jgi:hypothetical protein
VDEDDAMTGTRQLWLVGTAIVVLALGAADPTLTATPRTLLCKPPPGQDLLPPTARHGLIGHMRQYPAVGLATTRQHARARSVLDQLVAAAERGNWKSTAAAERAGYDTRTRTRKPGDRTVYFFHAERSQEARRGSIFNAVRPKALIYANAPGRSLILVGAMWSTRDGELGPTPAGPILRWHSHVVCKSGQRRGLKPPPSGVCPRGSRLQQGASEMLHVWFTGDLRSAFAVSAPRPELCAVGLLPPGSCRH